MPASEATSTASAQSRIRSRVIQFPVCRLAKTLAMSRTLPMVGIPAPSRGRSGRMIFPVVNVAADIAADVICRHRDHGAQEAVAVWEEVQMRIEGVDAFTLARHDDDQPAGRNTPQLGDGAAKVEDMLDHMGAHDGIE